MANLWDPFADGNRANPYDMYHRLRAASPVHRSQSGDIVLTGYQDIKAVLLNHNDFRSGNRLEWISRQVQYLQNKDEDLKAITDAMTCFIVMMNPPEHTELRTVLMEAWDNKDVDQLIKENVDSLLDRIDPGAFDAVKEFAEPLPAMTMARIMGLPLEDYDLLKRMATGVLRSLDMYLSIKQLVQIDGHAKQFIAYLDNYLSYRESNLSNDLVSKVIRQYKKKGASIDRRNMISICMFLFMAGEETTVNLIGTGLHSILNHPAQQQAIQSDAKLLDAAVDECLRFESPVQLVGRIATRDIELNGVSLKENDTLTLSLAGANRDPSVFQHPDVFEISRNSKNHLAFGAGAHFCLGSWLARKQWKTATGTILTKFPHLKICEPPTWNTMLSVRGLSSLKLGMA